MQQLFRLRWRGAPLVEFGVVPFEEDRVTATIAKVKDTVTVVGVPVEDVHKLVTLVFRQVLRNLGVSRVVELEPHIVICADPQVDRVMGAKIQRYTALAEVTDSRRDPGVGPVTHLVFVTVDVQREGFLSHARKRIRRKRGAGLASRIRPRAANEPPASEPLLKARKEGTANGLDKKTPLTRKRETPGAAMPGVGVNLPGPNFFTAEEIDALLRKITGGAAVVNKASGKEQQ